jgi:hypothetical protein
MEYWSQTGWDDVAKCWKMWWPGTELNRRRQPFQGCALPPELPGHISKTRPLEAGYEIVQFTPIVAGLQPNETARCPTRAERS